MEVKKTKENELMDALAFTGCTKLPRVVDMTKPQSKVWVRAIAQVAKVDGTWSYAVIRNEYGRRPKVVKTFGSIAAISSIKSVHPYEWLEASSVPKFKNEEDRIAFIAECYGQDRERISPLSVEDRDRLFYSWFIARQIAEQGK